MDVIELLRAENAELKVGLESKERIIEQLEIQLNQCEEKLRELEDREDKRDEEPEKIIKYWDMSVKVVIHLITENMEKFLPLTYGRLEEVCGENDRYWQISKFSLLALIEKFSWIHQYRVQNRMGLIGPRVSTKKVCSLLMMMAQMVQVECTIIKVIFDGVEDSECVPAADVDRALLNFFEG